MNSYFNNMFDTTNMTKDYYNYVNNNYNQPSYNSQNENVNLYNPYQGYIRGNMFPNLYNTYKTMFDKYIELQRNVFELAFRKGWYTLETAEPNKVSNKYLMLNQEYTDLNI